MDNIIESFLIFRVVFSFNWMRRNFFCGSLFFTLETLCSRLSGTESLGNSHCDRVLDKAKKYFRPQRQFLGLKY